MVSVIIPVRNAEAALARCLDALGDQSFPREQREVIVVDDGSTDGSRRVAEARGVRVLSQACQGPAAARNAGVAQARGELVLFTDADCVPDRDWIRNMVAPFAAADVAGVRGLYRCRQRQLVARFAQAEYEEKYERLKKGDRIDFIDTSAAAYRREVFVKEGGFDATFRTASGEDTDFSFRLAGRGYRLVLNPDAAVYHEHPARLRDYLRRKYKTAFWRVSLYERHPDKILSDSHTPQTLKLQIGAFGLLVASVILGFVWRPAWIMAAAALIAFAALSAPFVRFAARRDAAGAAAAPAFLFLRSAVFAAGLAAALGGRVAARVAGKR